MTREGASASDASIRRASKDLTSVQTGFTNKPLPPIRQSRELSPSRLTRHANARTPSISVSAAAPTTARSNAKMTLFNLFSRPKVEKLRGYVEPGLPGLTVPFQDLESRGPSPELVIQIPSPLAPDFPPPRPSTALSFRTTASRKDGSRSRERTSHAAWTAPPFFQVYSQSVKASTAETLEPDVLQSMRMATASSLTRSDGTLRHGSIGFTALPRKVFALCKSGYVLQYTDRGLCDRGPEKMLQLNEDSAAYACDVVPGRPFALQIAQAVDSCGMPVTSSVSILSRMGIKTNSSRREVATITMVLDSAAEMNGWMVAVREQIRRLGGAKKQVSRQRTPSPTQRAPLHGRRRRLSISNGFKLRTSMDVVTNTNDADSQPPSSSHTSRPRRASDVLSPLNKATPFTPLETVASSMESLPISSPISVVKRKDSAAPDSPQDSALPIEQSRKPYPFKIRSAIPDVLPSNTVPADHLPLIPLARTASFSNSSLSASTAADDTPRPDSYVAALPVMSQSRTLKSQTSLISLSNHTYMSDSNTSKPIRAANQYVPRRQSSAPINLPLKVNPSTTSSPIQQSPQRSLPASSNNASPIERCAGDKPLEQSPTPSTTASPRKRSRTPSVKLSLFPSPLPTPSAIHPANRIVSPPTRTTTETASKPDRPLRRPASLQVRPNHAPFLQSVPRSTSATRPTLDHSTSTPSLRTAAAATAARPSANNLSAYAPNTRVRRLHSEKVEMDTSDLTALPLPPSFLSPRGRSMRSSPLPALDLGLPIIGLAPPPPPPQRSLPELPPMSPEMINPQLRTVTV